MLEWATAEDSGRLLANVCEEEVPDKFWNRFYNISSGPSFRLTNYEFESKLLKAIGCPAPEKIFEPNWFAIRNFHGQWYTDSDLLEGYLHFRSNQTCDDYFKWMASQVPWYFHLAKIVPPIFIKLGMGAIAKKPGLGTRNWIKNRHQDRISAYFGSYEDWQAIPGWDKIRTERPSETPVFLDHGYDEEKGIENLDVDDLEKAAAFRGGSYEEDHAGDIYTPVEWKCASGHKFKMSVNAVLHGGHWCPECMKNSWAYPKMAKENPFYAQVWNPQHSPEEDYEIPMQFSAYDIEEELKEKLGL